MKFYLVVEVRILRRKNNLKLPSIFNHSLLAKVAWLHAEKCFIFSLTPWPVSNFFPILPPLLIIPFLADGGQVVGWFLRNVVNNHSVTCSHFLKSELLDVPQ